MPYTATIQLLDALIDEVSFVSGKQTALKKIDATPPSAPPATAAKPAVAKAKAAAAPQAKAAAAKAEAAEKKAADSGAPAPKAAAAAPSPFVGLPATEALYQTDTYLFNCEAKVLEEGAKRQG